MSELARITNMSNLKPTDDQLRDIARMGSATGVYSGGVKSLRAVWDRAAAPQMTQREQRERATRSEALERAVYVTAARGMGTGQYSQVVAVAKIFEAYLSGEEKS